MDAVERMEDPIINKANNEKRQTFKLKQRKFIIEKVIWSKRIPHQSIKG